MNLKEGEKDENEPQILLHCHINIFFLRSIQLKTKLHEYTNQHNNQYPLCVTCGLSVYIQKIHQRNADSWENMAWHTVVHLVPQCSSNGIPYYTETITTLSKAMYKTSAHYVRYNRMQGRYCLTDVNTKNPPSNTPPHTPQPSSNTRAISLSS